MASSLMAKVTAKLPARRDDMQLPAPASFSNADKRNPVIISARRNAAYLRGDVYDVHLRVGPFRKGSNAGQRVRNGGFPWELCLIITVAICLYVAMVVLIIKYYAVDLQK
ncbi:hypothetical protein F4781DRAFT_433561 [Annulohypoxylon bovei var. microspora]|nr:hypothetical protein F4781DRAFT_433561 [Annulohypoxylon bovei var. microspora]